MEKKRRKKKEKKRKKKCVAFLLLCEPGWCVYIQPKGVVWRPELMLLIHIFRVLSLQLKKLRWHNQSAIDLSNANPLRGHKEVPRSTDHIMVLGDSPLLRPIGIQIATKPLQKVHPTENIGNLSASKRDVFGYELLIQFLVSINRVLPGFQNLNY